MPKEAPLRNLRLLTERELEERRPLLLAGVQQFNAGFFFEAHETLEELWLPSPWPARNVLQGIIQLAAAFVHLMRHEYPGTVRLLDAGLEKIAEAPRDFLGVDIGRLVEEAGRARDELTALGPEGFDTWDRQHIPRIHLLQ